MAFLNFRHQLHLHWYKIVIITFLLLPTLPIQAQSTIKGENLPGYENRRLRWGFSLGMNTGWYQMEHSQNYVDQVRTSPSPYSANVVNRIGFNVNFITTYRLSRELQVRLQPGVGYYSRAIEYKGNLNPASSEGEVIQEVNTFSAELPILMKYESLRRKNTQMYFIAGVKPVYVVGGQRSGNPDVLQIRPFDFTIEYGVGLDMFYPFFKFSPELRYARGLSNVHRPFDSVYNNSIQRLTTNTITLYLNFE